MLVGMIMALAAATADPSNDGFQAFKTLCLATAGDSVAAVAAADQGGWAALSAEQLARVGSGVEARTKETSGGVMIFEVERSDKILSGVSVKISHCTLVSTGADYNSVSALAKAWAAVPASGLAPAEQGSMFVFADDRGRHIGIADAEMDSAMAQQLRDRKVMQLAVYNLSRGPSLRLTVFAR
jgi:hypothetical protein